MLRIGSRAAVAAAQYLRVAHERSGHELGRANDFRRKRFSCLLDLAALPEMR
jgi:hypothetical protein